ncbi:MAG: FIST C-terminal domain-containing protein [Gemmatimonadaceae bacterium]|nr:FIST C-terminal domain-containing protein [Gemmatimonadaceae bacterium]
MQLAFDRTGTLDGFRAALHAMAARDDVATVLVIAADGNDHVPATTDPILRSCGKPVWGAVFPQIVIGHEHLERGAIVVGLPDALRATVIARTSDAGTDLDTLVADAVDPDVGDSALLVLVDGLSRRVAALINALFLNFGLTVNYIGGGAGSLTLKQKPCLFTADGMLEDAAVLLQLPRPNGVGVAHGWEVVSEPLKVTRAEGTTILELDHEPAFDVYRRLVTPRHGADFDAASFFGVAKAYPFGIRKLDGEVVVRDPIMVDDRGGLVCVGEVPEGGFVHVLNGDAARLIGAARLARERAGASLGDGRAPRLRVLIDCISRVLFLDAQFTDELAAIDDAAVPMIGALTLGEIANSGNDFLEFYNKTAVVGVFAAA